tara:strand:+ start:85 stop:261 length:177 start_codon:yes stop_codon:yes gene_type:complete
MPNSFDVLADNNEPKQKKKRRRRYRKKKTPNLTWEEVEAQCLLTNSSWADILEDDDGK